MFESSCCFGYTSLLSDLLLLLAVACLVEWEAFVVSSPDIVGILALSMFIFKYELSLIISYI